VADILKITESKAKYDYPAGGHKKWQEWADAVKLSAGAPNPAIFYRLRLSR
jgi:hypothetical protein